MTKQIHGHNYVPVKYIKNDIPLAIKMIRKEWYWKIIRNNTGLDKRRLEELAKDLGYFLDDYSGRFFRIDFEHKKFRKVSDGNN